MNLRRRTCLLLQYLLWAAFGIISETATAPRSMLCYWDTSSVSRKGNGQFLPSHIDSTLCTHLVLSSAKMAPAKTMEFDSAISPAQLEEVFKLREVNPNLKILVSVNDMNMDVLSYHGYQDFPTFEQELLSHMTGFLGEYTFDGIDLDISDPDIYGKTPDIKEHIVSLLKYLRSIVDHSGHLLTVLVADDYDTADAAYDIPQIDQVVDFINLKSFDYHGEAEKFTGLNAPMYPRPDEKGHDREHNVDWTVNYWLDSGASPSKLVLGTSSLGRTFTLKDPQVHSVGAPVIGYGKAGPYLLKAGILGYNEMCLPVGQDGWHVDWEQSQQASFAYVDNQWVGYDDGNSIARKAEYANEKNLAGAMLWNIDTDDFLGECGPEYFPLLRQLHHHLDFDFPNPDPNPGPHPGPSPVCVKPGYLPDPWDCSKFYRCVDLGGQLVRYDFFCNKETVFNEKINNCDWPYNVPRCQEK